MNRLWIVAAVVAALVVGAIALNRDARTVDDGGLLLPELGERLNDVTRLRIQDADNTVTLVRSDAGWQVGERDYAAKLGEVRKTLIALAEATVFEPKTRNPALYERLGVQDFVPGEGDNTQVLLWSGDEQLPGLIVGDHSVQPSGTYVRVIGQDQSALITPRLNLTTAPERWLVPELTNIPPADIARIEVEPAGSDAYVIARQGDDLVLETVPEGRKAKKASVARVTRVLQNLRLDDVLPAGEAPDPGTWSRAVFTTTDGLRVVTRAAEHDGRKLLKLQAGVVDAAQAAEADDAEDETGPTPEARAEAINARAAGRVFVIQGYKYNDATLTLDLLLERPAEDS